MKTTIPLFLILCILVFPACQKQVEEGDIIGKWEMRLFLDENKVNEIADYPPNSLFSVTVELFTEKDFLSNGKYIANSTIEAKMKSPDGGKDINVRSEENGTWKIEGEIVEYIAESYKVFAMDGETEQELEGNIDFGLGLEIAENPGKIVSMGINQDSEGKIILEEVNNKGLDLTYKKQ